MAKKTPKKKVSPEPKPAKKAGAKPGAKKTLARPAPAKAAAPKKTPSSKAAPAGAKAKQPSAPPRKAGKPVKAEPKAKAKGAPARAASEPQSTKPQSPPSKAGAEAGKAGRKGITIVTPKPVKKAKSKSTTGAVPALTGSILGMGLGTGRPLIPSGPASAASGMADGDEGGAGRKPKSPFTKRQLDKYREVLIAKRRELLGDIDSMENEALKSQSGSLSHLPQHMAEQGSETYEQSLSLDLAAADRVLLREIDAALQRIEDRTYGLCEHTGRPISKERLAELPWARYSIEAAREMERRTS